MEAVKPKVAVQPAPISKPMSSEQAAPISKPTPSEQSTPTSKLLKPATGIAVKEIAVPQEDPAIILTVKREEEKVAEPEIVSKDDTVTIFGTTFRRARDRGVRLLKNVVREKQCAVCQTSLETAEPYSTFACGDSVHVTCGKEWLMANKCLKCNPHANPLAYDSASKVSELEKKYGPQMGRSEHQVTFHAADLPDDFRRYVHQISPWDIKTNLLDLDKLPMTYEVMVEKGVTARVALSFGLTLEQLYYKLGIKDWKTLKNFQYQPEYLADNVFGDVRVLSKLYNVDKKVLKDDMGVDLGMSIDWGLTLGDLHVLGWDMESMIGDGLTKDDLDDLFITGEYAPSPGELAAMMGMNRMHFFALKIGAKEFKAWRWNYDETMKVFSITEKELSAMGIERPKPKQIQALKGPPPSKKPSKTPSIKKSPTLEKFIPVTTKREVKMFTKI